MNQFALDNVALQDNTGLFVSVRMPDRSAVLELQGQVRLISDFGRHCG